MVDCMLVRRKLRGDISVTEVRKVSIWRFVVVYHANGNTGCSSDFEDLRN